MWHLSSPTRDWTFNVWIGNWKSPSRVQLAATPWTAQWMEFSRLPPDPGIRPRSPTVFTSWATREAIWIGRCTRKHWTTTGDPWAWLLNSSLPVTLDNNHCPAWRPMLGVPKCLEWDLLEWRKTLALCPAVLLIFLHKLAALLRREPQESRLFKVWSFADLSGEIQGEDPRCWIDTRWKGSTGLQEALLQSSNWPGGSH